MLQIEITADDLVSALLNIAANEPVCILDSCGVGHLGSHLLIAGIEPLSVSELSGRSVEENLSFVDDVVSNPSKASIFTISYDFGNRLLNITPRACDNGEPDVFLVQFEALIIHDYETGETTIAGDATRIESTREKLFSHVSDARASSYSDIKVHSNFTRDEYFATIGSIKEQIRDGNTYQTNLTHQLSATLPDNLTPEIIFDRLRHGHPAPFASFIKRPESTVISASPERFFRVDDQRITTAPIKGTRPRGKNADEDAALRNELLTSEKDRAENTMIVDLLRNDIGRICEFGSVTVEKLCDLEEHPTLFHLVSTISGQLCAGTKFSDILKAVFPCGSITGAPKISTMRIIDEIEPSPRGLSMGAIGYYVPNDVFGMPETLDLSVAIRTMVIRDSVATFNVGGGIVIDSDPEMEYNETLTKAEALLNAIGGSFESLL